MRLLLPLALLAMVAPALGQVYSEAAIHVFTPLLNGANPTSSLIEASDGYLYGTTAAGGAYNAGAIITISDFGGTPIENVIYSFTGESDGAAPTAALIQASDGNIYGSTPYGGAAGLGAVFRISDLAGTPTETVIYSFTGGPDGALPQAAVVQGLDGNLYGTAEEGGSVGYGTVFRISDLGGSPNFSVIHSFTMSGGDGGYPLGSLILASNGNLYGTTRSGGVGNGTVFAITDLAGTPTEAPVYSFLDNPDGSQPFAGLIQAFDGNLYGTTQYGGAAGAGAVFKIGNLGGIPTESVIYSFTWGADGGLPVASLIQASDGNLYGTTNFGGGSGSGTVFMITNLSGIPTESAIYSFTGGPDGGYPAAALIQASDGNLYGTAQFGASGYGDVFTIGNLGGSPSFGIVIAFATVDGASPYASLLQGTDGDLYGTTNRGGASNAGSIFKIINPGGPPIESVVYSFAGGADGAGPDASLVQASDGNLYGTTDSGGASNLGTVFKIINPGGTPTESIIHSFAGGADGANPYASLIQAPDGFLYGTTSSGGTTNNGTVFKIGNLGGAPTESVIYSFAGGTDGAYPYASLLQGTDGSLYGMTTSGGANGYGTVFRISDPAGTPIESVMYSFTGGADGTCPEGALIQASDGNLYGTASGGGSVGYGTVFRINDPAGTPTFELIYTFTGGSDGASPFAPLLQASDGNLYGTTSGGGNAWSGTVFTIGNLGGTPTFDVVHGFAGVDGGSPLAGLVETSGGKLYGTTSTGGSSNVGVVFAIAGCPAAPTAGNNGPICAGQALNLTASTVANATYSWSGPNGFTSSLQNPSITNATSADTGTYSVTATVSDCTSPVGSTTATVNPLPTPTITPSGPTIFCAGGSVTLDAGAGYSAFLWLPDGQTTQTIIVGASGSYAVMVMDGNGCQGTSAPVAVTVLPYPSPAITIARCLPPNTPGLTASVPASAGDTYAWTITGGTIDAGQGTNTISFTSGPVASLMTVSVDESNAACSGTASETMQVDFNDVAASNPFYNFVCTIARNGITAGCGAGNFCPSNSVLRSQMAVFLLRGEHGSAYTPPAATGIFNDVLVTNPFGPWIEELYNESITGGCGTNPLIYCPADPVTRASMAVLLLRAQNGYGYTPPACTGIFADVACPGGFTDWIEALYNAGITGGCGTNPLIYCPANPVTRAQMAVFLVAAFNLP